MTDALPTRQPVSRDDVRAAIEVLRSQGARVTLRGIRHTMGNRGSYDTIGAFRREIEGGAATPPVLHDRTPPQVTARLSELAPDIWREACAAARDAVAQDLAALQQQLLHTQQHERELEGLLAEADERLEREAIARAADQARVEQLGTAVTALTERLDATVSQHLAAATRAAEEIADREQTIAQLTAQGAVAQAQVEELRAAAHQDAQRMANDATARERLEQALSSAVNEQAQEQQRHGAALDLARHERDRALDEAAGRLRERDLARVETATTAGQLAAAVRGQEVAQVRAQELTQRIEHLASELVVAQQNSRAAATERDCLMVEQVLREKHHQALTNLATELATQRGQLALVLERLPLVLPPAPPGV